MDLPRAWCKFKRSTTTPRKKRTRQMADFAQTTPEFSRLAAAPMPGAKVSITESATEAECAALARRFGVLGVDAFSIAANLASQPGGALLTGEVSAQLRQECVVTMEPIQTRIDETFERRFVPDARIELEREAFDPESEDPPEPLTDEIDVGEIAAEVAALAIDPFPRAPGATIERSSAAPPGAAPLDDDAVKPFAGLAELKRRLESGGEGDA
jgi:uncharacterized metal-binding protein YceD (DUF177 family)